MVTGLVSGIVASRVTQRPDRSDPPRGTSAPSANQASLESRTVTLERRALEEVVSLRGTLAEPPSVPVRAPATGTVTELRAQINSVLAAGDLVAVVRPADTANAAQAIEVATPRGGVLRDTLAPGTRVVAGDVIGSVVPGGLDIVAPVEPPEAQYSLLTAPLALRAAIAGGPAGFDCPLVAVEPAEGKVRVRCRVPPEVRAFAGLTATLVLVTARSPEALVLPRSAVFGVKGQGEVVVSVAAGPPQRRHVTLGIADDLSVEIVNGLGMDEPVLVRPTLDDLIRSR